MTRSGNEPSSLGPEANTLTIMPMSNTVSIRIHKYVAAARNMHMFFDKQAEDTITFYFVSGYQHKLDKPTSYFHCGNIYKERVSNCNTKSLPCALWAWYT